MTRSRVRAGLTGLLLAAALALLSPAQSHAALDDRQSELRKLGDYVAEVQAQVERLQAALEAAERRNREQSGLIDRLEASLSARELCLPGEQASIRRRFFDELAARLGPSPVYRLEESRVVIAADTVFVFSRAKIGAEGESRLKALAEALREAAKGLPEGGAWRLRVEAHSDARPLRANSRFASNWELSAARATEVLHFLARQGFPERHLLAVAWAATVPAGDKPDHRRDRRIELRLGFEP